MYMTGGGLSNLRRKEVGEAWGFLIYTLLEVIGMGFHSLYRSVRS